jgi:hypothetical protein
MFIDEEGDDRYMGVDVSFGEAQGMAVFKDYKGNDEYYLLGGSGIGDTTLFQGRELIRIQRKTIGIFLDGQDQDKYPPSLPEREDKNFWQRIILEENRIGIGLAR